MRLVPEFPQGGHPDEIRILMLEDDAAFAALVRAHLDRVSWAKISLEWVDTLAGALERLAKGGFDLILSDLHVPDSNGLQTLETLARASDRLIIAMTGERGEGLRESAIEHGAYDLVAKDRVDRIELERLVRLGAMQANTFRSLRESEARFRSLVTQSWDWYWEQDEELRYTRFEGRSSERAQEEFDKALGRRRWEFPGLVPVSETWEEHRARLEARAKFRDFEYSWRRADGQVRYMSVRGEPVFDAGGAFRGYRGVATDITRRKEAEAERRRLDATYAALNAANEIILRAKTPGELLDRACAVAVEAGGFLIGNIFALDADGTGLSCVASSGPRAGLGKSVKQSIDASQPGGQGLIGLACRTQSPVISNDYQHDERTRLRGAWRGTPIGSIGVFPLFAEGKLAGAFAVQHEKTHAITGEVAALVQRLADNVSLALDKFRREKALRESEERFRQLTALSSDWCWEQDTNFRFTSISAGVDSAVQSRTLGKARWEMPGFDLDQGTWEEHRALLERHEPFRNVPMRVRQPDGSMRHVSVSAQPLFDEAGTFRGYRGTTRDITPNVRAEEALRRFRLAMDYSVDMIVLVDRASMKFVDVNETFCRLLGYSREELLSMGPDDILPVNREELEQAYDALIANPGKPGGMKSYYRRKDGSHLPFESTRHVLRSGDSWLVAAISRDIRERLASERALRESEERFRGLTELSSDWYWEQDRDFRFVRMSGRVKPEVVAARLGKTCWDMESDEPVSGTWEEHRAAVLRHEPYKDLLLRCGRADGSHGYVSVSAQPVFENGEFVGYRGSTRDVTERIRTDEDVRRFRLALDNSADLIFLIDPQSMKYVDANATACRLLGYSREELLAMGPHDVLPVERETILRSYEDLMSGSSSDSVMHSTYRCKDGSSLPFESTRHVVRSAGRSVIAAISRDIRERMATDAALRESEGRFRALTELSSDAFWEQDTEYRFTSITRKSAPQGGDAVAGMIGKRRWELSIFNMSEADWKAHRAMLDARLPFHDLELGMPGESGEQIWFSTSGEPVFDAHGRFKGYRGLGKNISARKREERLLGLEHSVARYLTDADSAERALPEVMAVICRSEQWECARYFELDEAADKMRLRAAWTDGSERLARFVAGSAGLAYEKGDGLVGTVWRTAEPLWVEDASRDPRVAMKGLAESAGLHAALVVPVTFEGVVMGVFSISNTKVLRPDGRLLRALEVIGAHMGQFLQRKQAEQELRESEARFRSLTTLSSDFFWQTDAQHRIKEVVHGPRHSPILESATGKARWELPFTSPDAAGWAGHKATMDGRQPFRDFEFGRIDGKGLERHLSISGEPIFDSDGVFLGYRGVGRDITDRRRAEQGLKLEHTVTRALADAESAAAALNAVMRCMCEIEGWECGRYFHRDDDDVFRLSESWHLPNPELEQFISYSMEKAFPLGIGIVGRAGAGEPQWVADVALDARVVSRPMASVHGMRAAFMFPVTSQGKSVGVLSFTNREIREPDERLLNAVRVIGSQIGQFLARKQVEQALGEEEARFRRTFELAATGIAHVGLGGEYLQVNRRLCEILGYDEAELLGRSVRSISHPDDTGRIDALRVRLHSGELPSVRAEKRYVRKDGELVWVDVSIALVCDAGGRPQHEIAVYEDITERKHTEEALRESELRFRNLSELSSDWFWEQDADLRFTRLYGRSKLSDAMIGKQRWAAPGVDPQAPEWREHIGALERRERFRDFEYSHLGRDGRRVHVRASGYPLFDAEGNFAGYRGLARNVTRQRESKEELRRFRTALDSSADMIMLFDVRTLTLLDFNETTCYFLGYPREELLGASFDTMLCDMSVEAMRASLEHLTSRKDGSDFTVRTYRRKNGTAFEVEVLRRIVDSPDGPILVLNARDLTERRRAEERQAAHLRYQEATARFGHLALAKHDAGALIDDAVLSVQEALQGCALAYVERGSGEGRLMVRGSAGLPEGEHASEARYGTGDTISRILDAGEMAVIDGSSGAGGPLAFDWACEFRSMVAVPVHGSGEVRGVLCALSRSSAALGPEESKFLTAAASLLSAGLLRIDSEDRLAFLAQFDALTGLPNRALLRDRFSQMIVQARRHATPLGVLFIDLDDFKLVNDSLGHAGGDDLLKQVAQRLQAGVRPGDTVARISGDEFAVILGDLAKAEDSALVAQKIIDRVGLPMQVRGQEVFVTASVGIAAFPADGDDADALLAAADAAMYRAKQSGRNGFQFFTVEINQRMRARAQLGSELRRALERGEFRLAYQPKYDLRTGMPCAAEALLRWEHPERGTVMPGEFIPVLEETGMIVAAGEWVLRTVCEDLKAWKAGGSEPLPVALNLSARQFREQHLDERIIELVSGAGVDPGLIELEITESQLMQDPDHAIRVVRALNDAGIRIAIDDFGTGYSSLTYLSRFQVSSLKIDRSFVADLMTDPADATIVRTIIDMAHTLGFTVVAEGVETEDQASFLRALGCEQAQGYLFARPMPEAQFRQLLHAAQLADMNG